MDDIMSDEEFARKMMEEITAQEQTQLENSIANEFRNVIDDNYDPYEVDLNSYMGNMFQSLKQNMSSFDEHTFITYMKDTWAHPNTVDLQQSNKVLICSSEHNVTPLSKIKHGYKHIFAAYHWDDEGITSIPLGYFSKNETSLKPVDERMYNITFIGCLNRNRVQLASILSGMPKLFMILGFWFKPHLTIEFINHLVKWFNPRDYITFNPDFNAGIHGETFINIMNNSKICLVPRGWSNVETYRLYEAMEAGCVVIAEKLPNRKYFKNIPVIQVDNWKEGLKKAKELLNNEELLTELSKKSKMFYDEFLSPEATAKIIIDTIENKEKV